MGELGIFPGESATSWNRRLEQTKEKISDVWAIFSSGVSWMKRSNGPKKNRKEESSMGSKAT